MGSQHEIDADHRVALCWGAFVMGKIVSLGDVSAISSAPAFKSGAADTPGTGSEDSEWFAKAAWVVLGKDAGLHLHYLTGYPESTCYAYVTKDPTKRRSPREHFLRKLIRSDQGEPFFNAFMEGCEALWWSEWRRQRAVGAAALRAISKHESPGN
jgi:hypothetical protein